MVSDGAVMLDSGMKASRTIWNVLLTPQTSYGPRTSPLAPKSSEPAAPSQLTEPPLALVVKARVQCPRVITVPDAFETTGRFALIAVPSTEASFCAATAVR